MKLLHFPDCYKQNQLYQNGFLNRKAFFLRIQSNKSEIDIEIIFWKNSCQFTEKRVTKIKYTVWHFYLPWNLTKSIRRRRLSRGLICIRFDDLTLLNLSNHRNDDPKLPTWYTVSSTFWRFDKCRAKIGPNLSNLQNVEPKLYHVGQFGSSFRWFDKFKSVKSSKRMHIRPRDNRLLRMDFVKFHCRPRR